MSAYLLIDEFLPILVVRRVGHADLEGVRVMLEFVDGHLAQAEQKLALVYDAGRSEEGRPDAPARKYGGEWIRARQAQLRRRCHGIDFAFASSVSRGALTAVFWIARPPVPVGIHATPRAAITEAIARSGARVDLAALLAALAGSR